MAEASSILDNQLTQLGRQVLRSGGRVSTTTAKNHAEHEYEKFKAKLIAQRHAEADRAIDEIKRTRDRLPGKN